MMATFEDQETLKDAKIIRDQATEFKPKLVKRNVILFVILHTGALYGLVLSITAARWLTLIWAFVVHIIGGLGITAGAHRLWSHRSYKAKTPLKILLMIQNCIAVQNDVIEWSRDHRVHHKFSETDADPHNVKRGLFFAHMGWLLMRKHPDVRRRGETVDISDLTGDPVLQFQRRFYLPLVGVFSFVLPTVVPWVFWNESLWNAYFVAAILRYCATLHATWTVNSIAHWYGYRPYDKTISPRENLVSNLCTIGEGWHNYHHSFPQDYRASEYPWRINLTTIYIDFFAALGLAYDRKTVSSEIIQQRKLRSGENFG